jgi:hypothetical protein
VCPQRIRCCGFVAGYFAPSAIVPASSSGEADPPSLAHETFHDAQHTQNSAGRTDLEVYVPLHDRHGKTERTRTFPKPQSASCPETQIESQGKITAANTRASREK